MRNFYEQELRKLFEDGKIVDDPVFSGRSCFGMLGKDIRMRAQFVSARHSKEYDALELTVLNRTGGPMDTLVLQFKDLLGLKMVPDHHYMRDGMAPHIWEEHAKVEWFSYQPTAADYETIRQAAKQYLSIFRDRMQEPKYSISVRLPSRKARNQKGRER